MSTYPGISLAALGPPGSGKSSLARKALLAEGSGVVFLAPGMDEEASYRGFRDNPNYVIRGYDDPEFYPSLGLPGLVSTGYDRLLADLRGVYKSLSASPEAERPKVLVTDTFNAMCQLAMNKTFAVQRKTEPPPALSPDGASFWGFYRNLQESLMRSCRAIRGCGLHWIATCHVSEKDVKEGVNVANPEQLSIKANLVPAISGGFRDVFAAGFDLVLFAGVQSGGKPAEGQSPKPPVHYLQWRPDPKRPTKSRYGTLGATGKIPNDWVKLMEKLNAASTEEG